MSSSDDASGAALGRERPRRQKQPSEPSRGEQGARRRASAPDVQRSRQRASTTGRRRSNLSDQTNARAPRAAMTKTAATGNPPTRVRQSGSPRPARRAAKRTTRGAPSDHQDRQAITPPHQDHSALTTLWRSLLASLRRLQRKLKRALATPQVRKVLTALLTRRLPGPLRVLLEGLGDPDHRGFLFWWLVVTLVATLTIALLLSIALTPVTGLVALLGVGVWMLFHERRQPATQQA